MTPRSGTHARCADLYVDGAFDSVHNGTEYPKRDEHGNPTEQTGNWEGACAGPRPVLIVSQLTLIEMKRIGRKTRRWLRPLQNINPLKRSWPRWTSSEDPSLRLASHPVLISNGISNQTLEMCLHSLLQQQHCCSNNIVAAAALIQFNQAPSQTREYWLSC